jgi:hypothetical protein
MAAERQSWILLDEPINSYLDRSEQSIHKFFKCWQIAYDGMQQMGLDFFYQIKSVKLPINPNFTVDLPSDFLNWSKVGVLNDGGEIIPLRYNDKLTTYAQFSPDRLQKTQDNTLFNWWLNNTPIWYNFWTGNSFSTLYGMPSGAPFVGNFKIDNNNGTILLNESFCYDYVMLEYISSPPSNGEPIYIPMQFKEAFMWYIAWQEIAMLPNTRRGMLGDKEQRRRNYFNERRLAWARYRPLHLEEAHEWSMNNTRLTVKI